MKKIIVIASDHWACSNYRLIQPYNNLKKDFNVDVFVEEDFRKVLNVGRLLQYDVIILQRVIDEEVLKIMKFLRMKGKTLIQECDDDLYSVKMDNPSYNTFKHGSPHLKVFTESLQNIDYLHVSTETLRQRYAKRMDINKIRVFPNAIDLNHPMLQENKSRRSEMPEDRLIIGYQGGSSHLSDLQNIVPVIQPVLEKFDNVDFAFCSHPSLFERNFYGKVDMNRVIMIPPITDKFDNFPNLPSMFDIGLVPLDDSNFNESKSYLKILEYGIWGVPTICSDVLPYREFSNLADDSTILVKNKPNLWVKSISELIQDNDLRLNISKNVKKAILEKFTLRNVNKDRYEHLVNDCKILE